MGLMRRQRAEMHSSRSETPTGRRSPGTTDARQGGGGRSDLVSIPLLQTPRLDTLMRSVNVLHQLLPSRHSAPADREAATSPARANTAATEASARAARRYRRSMKAKPIMLAA